MQLSFDLEKNQNPIHNLDGIIEYYEKFFDQKVNYFEILKNEITWNQDFISMYGKTIPLPRLTAFYGDEKIEYTYSKIKNQAYNWSPTLLKIKDQIEKECQETFNCVLINFYRDGKDHMSYHADNESSLGQNPTIASVSFGEPRIMQFRHLQRLYPDFKIKLESHSLLLMKNELQHNWLHKINPSAKITDGRINLTFRKIVS